MGKANSILLDTNDRFPDLPLETVSDGTVTLPEGIGAGHTYTVALFYRGYW
jgi:hypothetical protein